MLMMLAIILMVLMGDGRFSHLVRSPMRGGQAQPHVRLGSLRRLGLVALALSIALASDPALAGGRPVTDTGAQVQRPTPQSVTTSSTSTEARPSQAQDYASRELSAKNLEKFEGGSTTVVIGTSTLIVILLVVVIILLI